MLKELFRNRLFIGALAFFILCVVGGTLYISHVEKQGAEELATDEDSVKQVTEKQQQQPTAKAPVGDTSQGGHFHADGTWHGEPHAPLVSEVSEIPVSTSEFTRSELLARFPDYDFYGPKTKENLHWILRNEKILADLQAGNAELRRKIAVQEAQKELVAYLRSSISRLNRDYPDFMLFIEKYPNPEIDDLIREYPDASEREAFITRALEVGVIISEAADRILKTPDAREELDRDFLSELESASSLSAMIGGLLDD